MGNDLILEAKHKIFLSHSGAQKEFVDHLCKALEDRFHYPFYDRRHESLPMGERFPELIVQAVEQCEMLIVVVSDEYFMSKWPMIELSAFVQAHKLCHESKSSTKGPKIFPLFYGLSVGDLKDATMQEKWFQKWETLAEADRRNQISVRNWKHALDVLGSFNGLSYDAHLKEIVVYEEEIVSHVCKSISPDIKWDDSHVQGKSNICKVIGEKIEGIGVSRKYEVKVLGIYGVGGIGKTTTCKTLCNELLSKYEGRVCHIEFPFGPPSGSEEFFRKVLRDLTKKSVDVIQGLNEGQCKDMLRKSLLKQRTFLAIDNVSDSHESIRLAKMFLDLPYHLDSLVILTARSRRVLELLGMNEDTCLEMPDLGEVDAMRLFLQHATSGQQYFDDEEKHDIMTCVKRCYFSKGDGQGNHYHPLALQSLGLQLGCHGENPSLWVKHLPRVKGFNSLSGENPVFNILRNGFDLLAKRDQTLFMDVGCFFPRYSRKMFVSMLRGAHQLDEEEMIQRLEHLKRKGLLQHVDLESGKVTMHDLYLEFAELESKGSFNNEDNFSKRMWVCIEKGDVMELKHKPKGQCWDKLIRLTIKHWGPSDYNRNAVKRGRERRILEGIKWDYFSNVEVLHLVGVLLQQRSLNLEGLVCLRILDIFELENNDAIEGLGELKNLTHFMWCYSVAEDRVPVRIVGQLPSSLEELNMKQYAVLESEAFAQCDSLVSLCLEGVEALSLDLNNCWSLGEVILWRIHKLKSLWGLAGRWSSNLHSLTVFDCKDLVDIPGIDHLIGLKALWLQGNLKCRLPGLLALPKLQKLTFPRMKRCVMCSEDSIPRQLQNLCWCMGQQSEILNLNGCNQLEYLDLSFNKGLTSLAELGDLPALRHLDLKFCERLLRLPDLSKSRNLQKLNLVGCFVLELHERDIQMLCELPLLQPLLFEDEFKGHNFRLDLRRRKVAWERGQCESSAGTQQVDREVGGWEEQDLGPPPIIIGQIDPLHVWEEYNVIGTISRTRQEASEWTTFEVSNRLPFVLRLGSEDFAHTPMPLDM